MGDWLKDHIIQYALHRALKEWDEPIQCTDLDEGVVMLSRAKKPEPNQTGLREQGHE